MEHNKAVIVRNALNKYERIQSTIKRIENEEQLNSNDCFGLEVSELLEAIEMLETKSRDELNNL